MGLHKQFQANEVGTDYVVGDIHGCFSMLETALAKVGFDPEKDRLFSVGDLIDRGPESRRMVEFVEKTWFHPVMGNHEYMLFEYHLGRLPEKSYGVNGGNWAIMMTRDERAEYADAVSRLPVAITVGEGAQAVGIVHADCPTKEWPEFIAAMDSSSLEDLKHQHLGNNAMWDRGRITSADRSGVEGVSKVFVGHTPISEAGSLGNVHYIDTGAFTLRGALTLCRLDGSVAEVVEREW